MILRTLALTVPLSLLATPTYAADQFPIQDAKVIYQALDAVCQQAENATDRDAACTVERKVAGMLKAQGLCEDDGDWIPCDANSN